MEKCNHFVIALNVNRVHIYGNKSDVKDGVDFIDLISSSAIRHIIFSCKFDDAFDLDYLFLEKQNVDDFYYRNDGETSLEIGFMDVDGNGLHFDDVCHYLKNLCLLNNIDEVKDLLKKENKEIPNYGLFFDKKIDKSDGEEFDEVPLDKRALNHVVIREIEDEHDCDTCGSSYATGYIADVLLPNIQIKLNLNPIAHCYNSQEFSLSSVGFWLLLIMGIYHKQKINRNENYFKQLDDLTFYQITQ